MRSIVHSLSEANAKIDVLVHGREAEDVALATQLAANVPHAQMLSFRDPTQVRRRLAESSVVVSSRYHALVGAMAHGVPALGIGWTHKYQGLFNDFGLPQLCVGQQESSAAILDKLQRICSSAENVTVRDTIGRKLPEIARMNSGMWDEVARTLTG
jgi:colanic acid/amylovoran biosynthesis protein